MSPALVRLEDDGAILARWEQAQSAPAREVSVLTTDGQAQRAQPLAQWCASISAAATLGTSGAPSGR